MQPQFLAPGVSVLPPRVLVCPYICVERYSYSTPDLSDLVTVPGTRSFIAARVAVSVCLHECLSPSLCIMSLSLSTFLSVYACAFEYHFAIVIYFSLF